jgi:glycosyltransferase involved in cell wall biosynthesis
MQAKARSSTLFRDIPVHYIPNPFAATGYRPLEKGACRKELNLPLDTPLLLFGAETLDNWRKGGDLLEKAFQLYSQRYQNQNIEIILFGNDTISLPYRTHHLGYIRNAEKLNKVYSSADALLFPSREDNAPLTVSESLLCNTPVVAFPTGHVKDIVRHEKTGYIANENDCEDFATGINWALEVFQSLPDENQQECRRSALAFHDEERIMKQHLDVYLNALSVKG